MSGESVKSSWAKACGIGCLILVILAILGGIGVFLLVRTGFEKGRDTFAATLVQEYEQAKANNVVPADQVAVFDEVVAAASKDGSSMWAVLIGTGVILDVLDEGEITDEEAALVQEVRDFFREHPEVGLSDFGQFMESHPEMAENVSRLQQEMQPK
ncbi:MAG: hypothetical protein JXR94_09215 [Candidatus Hydrogenedentes bacterium]|nr:hypothetical protein [Candidatus Hydrogenedentota bacterium]